MGLAVYVFKCLYNCIQTALFLHSFHQRAAFAWTPVAAGTATLALDEHDLQQLLLSQDGFVLWWAR